VPQENRQSGARRGYLPTPRSSLFLRKKKANTRCVLESRVGHIKQGME
jgi:hypothetical protein